METKPYSSHDNESMMVEEPLVTYQPAPSICQKKPLDDSPCDDDTVFETIMDSDMVELSDGFRPFTWEEARQWIAKAEEDIAVGKGQTADDFFVELERDLSWL